MTVIASAYFNAALFSCLMPILLLVALVAWYVRDAERLPKPEQFFRRNGGKDEGTGAGTGTGASTTGTGSTAVGNG